MVSFFLSGFSRMNYRETVSPGSGIMQVVWLVSGYHNPKMIGIVLFQVEIGGRVEMTERKR